MGLNFLVRRIETFYISGVGKKWRIIIVAAVAGVVIGGIAWRWPRPTEPEPVYLDRPLSAWIDSLHGGVTGIDFAHTWQDLSTDDAVAILKRALEARDSKSQKIYKAMWWKLPSGLRRHPLPYPSMSAEDAHVTATVIIGTLGEAARPAIPALIDVLKKDEIELARRNAVYALAETGPRDKRVSSALREACNDPSSKVREAATNILARISRMAPSAK